MAYIGLEPSNSFVSLKRQVITGDGTASYTLDHSVASVNDVAIFVNNVRQDPAGYSISGAALTLGGTIESSDDCYVIFLGQALQTVTPDSDTITATMLKSSAVTTAKLGDNAVTTAKMFSGFANGITEADQFRLSADRSTNETSFTDISSNLERNDNSGFGKIGTGVSESSGVFTFASTGTYFIQTVASWLFSEASNYNAVAIYSTINNSDFTQQTETHIAGDSNGQFGSGTNAFIFNCTNTSTHKVKFRTAVQAGTQTLRGNSTKTETHFNFIRLGDST